MSQDQMEYPSEQTTYGSLESVQEALLPRVRAYLSTLPEVRLAYYQSGPDEQALNLAGPDHPRVVIVFTRSVSVEHIDKRLAKIRKHFAPVIPETLEFMDLERMSYREACEVAFNAQVMCGGMETAERDRLYRYNIFLEWNASKRIAGAKMDPPPEMLTRPDRPVWVMSIHRFITPIYRHLKLIENHMGELRRITQHPVADFARDASLKSLAESYMLKSMQSAILITMSVMHRKVRLSARDYRDLFLHLPVFGMASRERAAKLAGCAEIRDRLMFKYDEVTPAEVYEHALQVIDVMQDFRLFMLEWLFEHYYAPSGELIQTE